MIDDDGDDEPTEFELAQESRIDRALAASSDAVRDVIDDCHEAFGHGITTVVLGQVGQWYWKAAASTDPSEARDAQRAAQVLADLYETGDEFVQTVIATGFLEALPLPSREGPKGCRSPPRPSTRRAPAIGELEPRLTPVNS